MTDTDDVKRRLHDHENEGVTHSDRYHLREKAADTIERLQAALRELVACDQLPRVYNSYGFWFDSDEDHERYNKAWQQARALAPPTTAPTTPQPTNLGKLLCDAIDRGLCKSNDSTDRRAEAMSEICDGCGVDAAKCVCPPICRRCHQPYTLREGMEPTPFCDSCAHAEIATLRAEVQTQRDCRLANEAELRRADTLIGELRADRDRLQAIIDRATATLPEGTTAPHCLAIKVQRADGTLENLDDVLQDRDRLRAELEGVRADMDWLERRDVRVSNPRRYGEGECVIQTVLELEEDRTDLRKRIAALRRQS